MPVHLIAWRLNKQSVARLNKEVAPQQDCRISDASASMDDESRLQQSRKNEKTSP